MKITDLFQENTDHNKDDQTVTDLKAALKEHKKDQGVAENFADGKNPQDKGDSRRHGIPKKSSLSSLDKIVHSKSASPRKKQLAHWQANMRRGRKD